MAMTRPIRRILVANRGEIARRVFRTARSMGIETVAIYSEPDSGAPFVDEADMAIPLRGATSAETYLDVAQVIEAIDRSGADAVHPGYGFLSENPEFAEAVIASGAVWIGPTPSSMRAMALKVEAKHLAASAGLPLVPGAELPPDVDAERCRAIAEDVGYPLLIKASAGGGGKGMRVVESPDQLGEALNSARREAGAAFGDPTVFFERYLIDSRHIEVQVFGDVHGNVVHLGERECSIQRRHQKIVEESPAPGIDRALAAQMHSAAVALAQTLSYVGAGTVEFIVWEDAGQQRFAFLEMNTRLQVEHPVTEMVTGLDLVEWQIRVSQGEDLPCEQDNVAASGHAIEVRLYAEDPAHGYLPSIGTVECFDMAPELRVDSGVEVGSTITTHYDPMLAKVIAHAADRPSTAAILARGLRRSRIHGVVTNRDSLVAIVESAPFLAGETTTGFLDSNPDVLSPHLPDDVRRRHLAAVANAVAPPVDGVPRGWRNVPAVPELLTVDRLGFDDAALVAVSAGRGGCRVSVLAPDADPYGGGESDAFHAEFGPGQAVVVDGVRTICRTSSYDELICIDDGLWSTQWRLRPQFPDLTAQAAGAGPATPMPGTIVTVEVAVGDAVIEGQTVVVLEAMKMEHRITADLPGVVAEVFVSPGQAVDAHTVVVRIEPMEEAK